MSGDLNLCPPCSAELPRLRKVCALCALPGPGSDDRICGRCLVKPPPWSDALAALVYGFPVNDLVHRFKFGRSLACGRVLADELLLAIRNDRLRLPELIIPVPLHRNRQFARVFNQADVIACRLGSALDIPVDGACLHRRRRTRAQSGLDAQERRRNIRGAFRSGNLRGALHVAVVDDVLTTGATLGECARVLRRAGAHEISIWTAARSLSG